VDIAALSSRGALGSKVQQQNGAWSTSFDIFLGGEKSAGTT